MGALADSGDGIHPGTGGYEKMVESINDLSLFSKNIEKLFIQMSVLNFLKIFSLSKIYLTNNLFVFLSQFILLLNIYLQRVYLILKFKYMI